MCSSMSIGKLGTSGELMVQLNGHWTAWACMSCTSLHATHHTTHMELGSARKTSIMESSHADHTWYARPSMVVVMPRLTTLSGASSQKELSSSQTGRTGGIIAEWYAMSCIAFVTTTSSFCSRRSGPNSCVPTGHMMRYCGNSDQSRGQSQGSSQHVHRAEQVMHGVDSMPASVDALSSPELVSVVAPRHQCRRRQQHC